MREVSVAVLAGAMITGSAVSSASAAPAPKPQTQRISLSSTGEQIQQGTSSPGLSANGRYALFVSEDSDVVPGDTNGQSDVFVRDLRKGTVERVNVASDGTQANASTYAAQISANGRYVVFTSSASNLVTWSPQPPSVSDAYVHDRRTGRTERVSVAPDGGTTFTYERAGISADGRYVAFVASARRMEAAANNQNIAYVVDRRTGTVKRISDRVPSDWDVSHLALSADGSHLAYVQRHPRGGRHELWLADLRTGEQKLVNTTPEGQPTNGAPGAMNLSADGSLIAYSAFDERVVPEAPTYTRELYLFDNRTGKTRWMTHEGKGELSGGLLSPDGRQLAYGVKITPDGGQGVWNVYVRNLETDRIQLVTHTLTGGPQTEGSSGPTSFTRNGRKLGFTSSAPDLVPGDTNAASDAFVRRLR